ncbi:MAG: aldo/keto reductase, partial [Nitrososphaerales archaeon]
LAPDAEYERGYGKYIADRLIATGIIRPDEIVDSSHCMTIPYLKHELKRSLSNLKLDTVDLLYLHNSAEAQIPSVGKKQYLEDLRDAFSYYESARKEGCIRFYGLATWDCFRRVGEGHLELGEAVALAEESGGVDHGFRFVQFPFNLAMPEALVLKNQRIRGDQKCTLLEACIELGIGAFTSVPLMQGQLISHPALPKIDSLTAAQTNLQFARSSPGIVAPLVGQKNQRHVQDNLALALHSPLSLEEFKSYFK